MNPRTATLEGSVWRPVTENLFQKHIATLWKITSGKPKDPTTYTLPAVDASTRYALPLQVELDLAKCFAFISASGVGSEYVSAAAVETPIDAGDGLVLNIASNRDIRPNVKKRLSEVARYMRDVAAEELTRDQCKDRIVEAILELNRARINARLKTRKGSRHIVLEGLQSIFRDISNLQHQTNQLKMLVTRLNSLCQSLHQYHRMSKRSQNIDNTKNLVVACYDFCSATDGESIKGMLICAGVDTDGSRGNPHIRQIGKIAAYYHVAEMLVAIASGRVFRALCLNISTRYVQAYDPIRSTIASLTDGCGELCPVHAEVQLVVDFDTRIPSVWRKPRAIGSSKAACFLCELFLRVHGDYFVPETHGKLTPRWTIPDLVEFTAPQISRYRNIIDVMDQELRRLATISHPKRLDPAMSWQALSQLNVLPTSPSRSTKLASKISVAHGDFAASAKSVLGASDSRRHTASRKTNSIAVSPLIGQSTERSCRMGGDLPMPKAIGILRANNLDCKNERSETNSPDAPTESNARTAEQISTFDKDIVGNRSPKREEPVQVRPLMNLDCKRRDEPAETIRGHEGRTSNVPSECAMSKQNLPIHFDIAHSDGISQRVELHDLELFFEIEYPATAQVSVFPCTKSETSGKERIVDVDKLDAGDELILDIKRSLNRINTMFISKRSQSGTDKWWKIVLNVNV